MADTSLFSSGGFDAKNTGEGIVTLNNCSSAEQTMQAGGDGDDFSILTDAEKSIHTFNIPNASGTKRGFLTSDDWAMFNAKQDPFAGVFPVGITAPEGSTTSVYMNAATGSTAGHLSAADWTTFNAKQATLSAVAPLSKSAGNTLTFAFGATTVVGETAIGTAGQLFYDNGCIYFCYATNKWARFVLSWEDITG
jgi:hypothetical protein